MTKPPPDVQGLIHAELRRFVARKGLWATLGHVLMLELSGDLAAVVPKDRPVEVMQPGKSAKARSARLDALASHPEPVEPAVGECHQGGCVEPSTGWRLYVAGGWQRVCSRHMAGAKAIGRRFNRDLVAGSAGAEP